MALEGLQGLEPTEPRWPHRAGETLRRLGRLAEATDAFLRAIELYHTQGFSVRADALVRSLLQLNPSKADEVARIRGLPAPSPFTPSEEMRSSAPTRPSFDGYPSAEPAPPHHAPSLSARAARGGDARATAETSSHPRAARTGGALAAADLEHAPSAGARGRFKSDTRPAIPREDDADADAAPSRPPRSPHWVDVVAPLHSATMPAVRAAIPAAAPTRPALPVDDAGDEAGLADGRHLAPKQPLELSSSGTFDLPTRPHTFPTRPDLAIHLRRERTDDSPAARITRELKAGGRAHPPTLPPPSSRHGSGPVETPRVVPAQPPQAAEESAPLSTQGVAGRAPLVGAAPRVDPRSEDDAPPIAPEVPLVSLTPGSPKVAFTAATLASPPDATPPDAFARPPAGAKPPTDEPGEGAMLAPIVADFALEIELELDELAALAPLQAVEPPPPAEAPPDATPASPPEARGEAEPSDAPDPADASADADNTDNESEDEDGFEILEIIPAPRQAALPAATATRPADPAPNVSPLVSSLVATAPLVAAAAPEAAEARALEPSPAPEADEPRQTLPFPSEFAPALTTLPHPVTLGAATGSHALFVGASTATDARQTLALPPMTAPVEARPTPRPSAIPSAPPPAPQGPELAAEVDDHAAGRPADASPEPTAAISTTPTTEASVQVTASRAMLGALGEELGLEAGDAVAALAATVEQPDTSPLFQRGEPADDLYLVLSGRVRVEHETLQPGQLVGDEALLEGALRPHDAHATDGPATLLRVPGAALRALAPTFPAVARVFAERLERRLVATLLATSPLFTVFDPHTQRQLLELFELRKLTAGETLEEGGKRSEGMWILLAGELTLDGPTGPRAVPLHGIVGAEGVLGAPAAGTLRVTRAGLALRLGARRFGRLMAEYPPALAHLSELV